MSEIFEFAGFRFSSVRGLERGGYAIPLSPQVKTLLATLVEAQGGVVTWDAIASTVWEGRPVSDNTVDRCVHRLRKVLGPDEGLDIVQSVYGVGLRIAPPIRLIAQQTKGRVQGDTTQVAVAALYRNAFEVAARRSREALRQAKVLLLRVTELDQTFLPGWMSIADLVAAQASRGHIDSATASQEIEQICGHVLGFDANHPHALALLGWVRAALQRRPAEGIGLLDRAAEADPNSWMIAYLRAWALAGEKRLDDALAQVDAGLVLSPAERGLLGLKAALLLFSGHLQAADEFAAEHLRLRPDLDTLLLARSLVAGLQGRGYVAVRHAEAAVSISERDTLGLCFLAYAHAVAGQPDKAEACLREAAAGGQCFPPRSLLAAVDMALGNRDRAMEWLAEGETQGPWTVFAWCDPRLSGLAT